MSYYTHLQRKVNEIHIKQDASHARASIRNVSKQFLSKSFGHLSKHQRHYRCRSTRKLHSRVQLLSQGAIPMKLIKNTWNFLIAFAESLHEYRSRKGYRNGGYY